MPGAGPYAKLWGFPGSPHHLICSAWLSQEQTVLPRNTFFWNFTILSLYLKYNMEMKTYTHLFFVFTKRAWLTHIVPTYRDKGPYTQTQLNSLCLASKHLWIVKERDKRLRKKEERRQTNEKWRRYGNCAWERRSLLQPQISSYKEIYFVQCVWQYNNVLHTTKCSTRILW